MIVDCPHCLTRVMVAPGGACPSCRSTIEEADLRTLEGFATVTVDEGTRVPDVCFLCESPRTRALRVHVRSSDGGIDVTDAASRLPEAKAVARPLVKFLAGWLYGGLLRLPEPREDPGITVFLPVCESCFAQRRRVRVTATSWPQRSVTVLASQSFARHLQQAPRASSRPGADGEPELS